MMLGHGAGIGYTGPGLRMGPTDNFSLVTGPHSVVYDIEYSVVLPAYTTAVSTTFLRAA